MNEEEIFHGALARNLPEERATYLEQACSGNQALRASVEELLRANIGATGFLDHAVAPLGATMEEPMVEGPGTVIGPYKLLEQIGEGGFGVVFMAEQMHPVRRKVALKVLKPGMDTRQVIARFEAERQALAIMDHPNIAKVLDAGATPSGRPHVVMELVRGVPITDFCDQNHLTLRQRLELFIAVCQAVQHAHHKGIIHRDLKPSNVMVTVHDTIPVVKVIDFGIAKALGQELTDRSLFTGFTQMIGTPLYMSPEQAGQSGLDIDTRSDIYSLGVLLYELLTGSTPFDKQRFQKMAYDEIRRIIREEEPPKPSTRLTESTDTLVSISTNRHTEPAKLTRLVRGELDWIVMKALEKDRNRRYETANGIAQDLQRYLADEPVQACPPSARYRLRKFARRHQRLLIPAAVAAGVLLLGAVISAWLAVRATEAEGLAEKRLHAEMHERRRAVEAERDAKHQLFKAKLAEARASRFSHQVGQRFASLQALREAAALSRVLDLGAKPRLEIRNEAIACLALTDIREVKKWHGWPAGSSAGLAFDAKLEHYARSDMKGNISLRRVDDDEPLVLLPGEGPTGAGSGVSNMIFSPDGGLLAVTHWEMLPGQAANFRMWDWRQGRVVLEAPFAVHWSAMGFSADGKQLALGRPDGTVAIFAQAGTNEWTTTHQGKQPLRVRFAPSHLAFHPDGARLAVASARSDVEVLDLATGAVLHKLSTGARVWKTAWHPDGVLLAAACDNQKVYLWDAASGREHAVLQGHQAGATHALFSLAGDLLLSGAWDGTSRLWDPWTGRELLRWAGAPVQISRDGRRLACRVGNDLVLWEFLGGRECRTLPRTQAPTRGGDISPNGRWLAVATSKGVQVWDLTTGKDIGFAPLSKMEDVKFHPSGKGLFTSGSAGLFHWPVDALADSLRIGPARRLPVSGSLGRISLDLQANLLAVVDPTRGGRTVEPGNRSTTAPTLAHENIQSIAASPDGRWVATGTQHGYGVRIWDTKSGTFSELIPEERWAWVAFSPDNRWLVTTTESTAEIWEVGAWRSIRKIPRKYVPELASVFSPDGTVLAVTVSHAVVALIDPASGSAFAQLQAPDDDLVSPLAFSPDGSQLVVSTRAGALRVWDLRLLRAGLQELGLDWDLRPYAPPRPSGQTKPVRLESDLGDFERAVTAQRHFAQGWAHAKANRCREAVQEYDRAIELQPEHADAWHNRGQARCRLDQWEDALADLSKAHELAQGDACLLNNLAWMLATCPEPQLRDSARALTMAQKAVQLAPHKGAYWNTLGVAQFRAGSWQLAVEALTKSMDLQKGGAGDDFFFLAMTHWQLGSKEEARKWHDKAVAWMDKNMLNDAELRRFRVEAEMLFKNK